ncbi:MAG TPA: MFS transporter [Steroidobacteraceae bacterium]
MTNAAAAVRATPAPRFRVRWRICLFMLALSFLSYVQQRGLAVAGYKMMPELSLSQDQLGWLETAFLIGYAGMQLPGGILGQRLGARLMFVLIGIVAFVSTMTVPLAPLLLTGSALFAVLLGAQLLFGGSQGPVFPVGSGVFEAWFPARQWPLVQGLSSTGANLGAALVPPMIAWLMTEFDWQRALVWTTVPAFLVALWWGWYGRNTPAEHRAVNAAELAELGAAPASADQRISMARLLAILRSRDILLVTVSYMFMNYTYYLLTNWCFLYLVQERHFEVVNSGVLSGAPPFAAAVGAAAGGALAAPLVSRFGLSIGLRSIPLLALPAAGLLLWLGVRAANPYVAVGTLTVCFGVIELIEGPVWATVMEIARDETMAATGVLNTGGNIGGIIGTPIVAYLSARHSWTAAFLIGTAFALIAAALWLFVDPTRRLPPHAAASA